VPSGEELLETTDLLGICRHGKTQSLQDGEEPSNCGAFRSFEDLRSRFLNEHVSDLDDAGMMALRPVPLAPSVQNRFLSTCNEYGPKALVLGYHGTPTRNHESIFQQGLRIPGNGNVRVANGNAHGRGVYIAEKGSHWLSVSFLRGDSQMLICGVIDNTLVDMEEPEENKSRFVFHGSTLAHRCHHRPKLANSSTQQSYVGGRPLYAETAQVRHVGNAMVVRHEDHVAPLYVAHAPGFFRPNDTTPTLTSGVVAALEPSPNKNHLGQVAYVARQQVVDPRTEEQCWLEGEASSCTHGRKIKRAFERRKRQEDRRQMRDSKYSVL